jgi:hypothetical protein
MSRPDPLQLPETAGEVLVSRPMATWLSWSALSIAVAVGSAIALSLVWPHLEAAALAFGAGMAWSAATPRVIGKLGRWARG